MSLNASMIRKVGAAVLAVSLMAGCSGADADPDAPSRTDAAGSDATSVRILNDCPELPCGGRLESGKYRWTFSEPTIEFEIPSPGWKWYYSGGFQIVADEAPTIEGLYIAEGVYLLQDPSIASRDCEERPEPGVGRSVDDIASWIEAAPGLAVSDPIPVTVGGLDGVRLDFELDPAWKKTCFFSEGLPVVPLIFSGARLGGYHWAIVPDQAMRWYILRSDDGVMIVDIEDGPGGMSHDDVIRTGSEIVDSLAFSWPT